MSNQVILVTGCAGFIGFHLCQRLIRDGLQVVGVDCINDYYDPQLKRDRLALLTTNGLQFIRLDLSDGDATRSLFRENSFQTVVHLAAQAGVRHSLNHPHAYTASNIEGFLNVLEGCRHHQVKHLIYASSSSVYGANQKLPCSTSDLTDRPVSLYGATKKANELMAHSYSWMYGLATTGLRFFTVYGPWGRPDMALYLFASAILEDRVVELFNYGKMKRDFTYVEDVTEAISRLLDKPAVAAENTAPAHIFNVGNHSPVDLADFFAIIERCLNKKGRTELKPLQLGDVLATYADVSELESYVGYRPDTPLQQGIERSLAWYLDYRRQRGM